MSITVNKVTKFYGRQKALDNVSFHIPDRQIVGFIGPNGAGKTTLMRIITGYLEPSKGEVLVNGLPVSTKKKIIQSQIGYLPENNPLYYDMYVEDFLMFVASIFKLKNKKQQVEHVIKITGLGPERKKKIAHLSKGYKQRVGLAQAILHNPSVLILDEPTSGLDPNQIIEIRNLIKQLGQQKTVLLSTHIMQEVEAICDRIIIINKGKIIADDTPETIENRVEDSMLKFLIEFDRDVKRKDLETIPGVEEIHYIKDNKWLIISLDDIRKNIFQFAVSRNLTVLTIEQKKKNLEEIFRELTTNANHLEAQNDNTNNQ